jgi:CheY-like chemotaxis protein
VDKPLAGKKILVVDDNLVVLRALRFKLELKGALVYTAADAMEAYSAMRMINIDLVLLDLGFPPDIVVGGDNSEDGFNIISWMRRHDVAKDIPIIIITGSDPAFYRDRAEALGVAAIFKKPVDYFVMFAKIEEVFTVAKPEFSLHR